MGVVPFRTRARAAQPEPDQRGLTGHTGLTVARLPLAKPRLVQAVPV
eukprot:SAG11_NODE_24019_length_379_cov_0.896429_1_plen_46_part_10